MEIISRFRATHSLALGIDLVLQRIRTRLVAHKFCIVFGNEIDRVWPREKYSDDDTRAIAIQEFAKANKLIAVIHDPGVQVTFKKLDD